jgi:ferritin-like metal-binding protein YciE
MKIPNLQEALIAKVMALYDVETQLVKAIPKMIKSATHSKLKDGLTNHLAETETHVERIEKMFESLNLKPKKLKVEAIRGLVDDAAWCMEQDASPAVLDAMIISSASYVEHYEIAGYTSLLRWARTLNLSEIETLAEETLDEEKNSDETLAAAAEEIDSDANDVDSMDSEDETM